MGVPTLFEGLEKILSSLQKSRLYVIAARPSMGKTAFMLSLAKNAALQNHAAGIFSLEMSSEELAGRLMSQINQVELQKITNAKLSQNEFESIVVKGTKVVEKLNIYIDDTASISITELKSKARRLVKTKGVKLIIIDYLQLMSGSNGANTNRNREQEISEISRKLKGMAKELDVPVIALSQLSRDVEKRGGEKRPQLSDLRESGAIEQDADCVMFMYRPEYYGITTDLEGNSLPKGFTEVIIAKNRGGGLGTANFIFTGKYVDFEDINNAHIEHTNIQPNKDFWVLQ
jgi:replicative DNA helicase